MANRHLSRSIALQTMFELDFKYAGLGGKAGAELPKDDALRILTRNASEFAPGVADTSFMSDLLEGVLSKVGDIDHVITKAAPDWPIDKISAVDRNILRLGLYELMFSDRKQTPPKVAINEAIELAKTFGGETSGRFVNGVLGAVYKELGEPGKEESSALSKSKHLPYDKLPVEHLGGAVVYAALPDEDDVYLALVHDVFGHWTLSKGHIKDDESKEEGVERIVGEELGLESSVKDELGANEYVAYDPEKGKIRKQVTYYLVESSFRDLKLKESGGLDDAKWFRLQDILELNFYDDIVPIITEATKKLVKND